jgi:hypothetical protein
VKQEMNRTFIVANLKDAENQPTNAKSCAEKKKVQKNHL